MPSTWLLPSVEAATPLYSFLRKRSSRSEHMPNRRLAGRPRRNLLLELENRRIGAPRLVNGEGPRNRDGYYAPADRVTEITKSSPLSALCLSLSVRRPLAVSLFLSFSSYLLASSSRPTSVQNSARVCAHGQCSCAIWTLRRRFSERADPRLDSISRISSVTQRGRTFVVSQFCMRLTAVPGRRGETRRII